MDKTEVLAPICPVCRNEGGLRESIIGMPIEPIDESKFYIAGCTAEDVEEVVCIHCGMGMSAQDFTDFLTFRKDEI